MPEPPIRPEPESRPPSFQVERTPPEDTPPGGQSSSSPATALPLVSLLAATVAEEATATGPQRSAARTFGRYERLEELPRSGMGVVYKAWDPVLKIEVALKTMQAAAGRESPELAERFDREAQALALCDHPHIVRIYDTGRYEGQAYFTMGFMSGGSVDRQLGRFRDPRSAAIFVEKVARAMHYVHERGILHRDLKPANILLDERGEPRVTDFGLAKFRDGETELTHPGAVLGTLPYMAPEQASGQIDRIGPSSDVWAMGVILFELLTGRRPFEGRMREAVASLICTSEPPKPRGLRPDLDRALEIITLKCLEKRPEDRYHSAAELADDLGRWLAGESIRAKPPSPKERLRRFYRRHSAACTAAVLLTTFVLLIPFLPRGRSTDGDADRKREQQVHEENLRQLQEGLAHEDAKELISPEGLPKWSDPRVGSPEILAVSDPPATLEMWNRRTGALDLLPKSPRDSYRFSADVAISRTSSGETAAGIYVAAIQWPGPEGRPEQWFASLSFPDDVRLTADLFELHRCVAGEQGQFERDNVLKLVFQRMPNGDRIGLPADEPVPDKSILTWRRLQLDVSRQGITAWSQGKRIGVLSIADLQNRLAMPAAWRPKSVTPPAAELLLSGGLGLYNKNANTWFRNVVVEPLP
jgi:serine/threonine-protein kinase